MNVPSWHARVEALADRVRDAVGSDPDARGFALCLLVQKAPDWQDDDESLIRYIARSASRYRQRMRSRDRLIMNVDPDLLSQVQAAAEDDGCPEVLLPILHPRTAEEAVCHAVWIEHEALRDVANLYCMSVSRVRSILDSVRERIRRALRPDDLPCENSSPARCSRLRSSSAR